MKPLAATSLRFLLYLILVAPLLLFIVYAFSTRWFFPQPFPLEWTTETFRRALQDTRTLSSLAQGLGIAILVSILSVLLALPADAYWDCAGSMDGSWYGCSFFCPRSSLHWRSAWD